MLVTIAVDDAANNIGFTWLERFDGTICVCREVNNIIFVNATRFP